MTEVGFAQLSDLVVVLVKDSNSLRAAEIVQKAFPLACGFKNEVD